MNAVNHAAGEYPASLLLLVVLPWLWGGVCGLGVVIVFAVGGLWVFLARGRKDLWLTAVVLLAVGWWRDGWEETRRPPGVAMPLTEVLGFVEREASLNSSGEARFLLRAQRCRYTDGQRTLTVPADFSLTVRNWRGASPPWGQKVVSQGSLSEGKDGWLWRWQSGSFQGWALPGCAIRAKVRERIFGSLNRSGERQAGLAKALLLGATDELSPGEKQAFRQSGTSHVLALSGMHLSLLALVVSRFLRGKCPRLVMVAVVQIVLASFCWLAGPLPSLYRAWMMAAVGSWSLLTWRKAPAIEVLSLSYLLTVLLWPDMVSSLSLQLSGAALAGLLLVSPSWERAIRPYLGRWGAGTVAVSGSAVLTTAPLAGPLSGGLCWAGVLWTPPLVALTGLYMLVSLVFLVVSLMGLPGEALVAQLLTGIFDTTFILARAGNLPLLPIFWAYALPVAGGVGFLAVILYKGRRRNSLVPLNYDSAAELQAYLEGRGLNALRRWGQNFLINPGARKQILNAVELAPGEAVWEIGPGLGALTHQLLAEGHPVTAFEIDPGYIEVLNEELGKAPAGLCLVWGDAIKTWRRVRDGIPLEPGAPEWPDFSQKVQRVVGNLPYNAASAILGDFLEGGFVPEVFVVTVQKEMADRMTALPGTKNYSSFSVMIQAAFSAKAVVTLRPGSFHPAPEVTSTVVQLKAHHRWPHLSGAGFSRFVRECYSSRRKTLRNNLGRVASALHVSDQQVTEAFLAEGINLSARAETLGVEQFVAVFQRLPLPR